MWLGCAISDRYQNAPDKDSYPYEDEFFDYLTRLHNDLERKIRRGKERKDKEVDETVSVSVIFRFDLQVTVLVQTGKTILSSERLQSPTCSPSPPQKKQFQIHFIAVEPSQGRKGGKDHHA